MSEKIYLYSTFKGNQKIFSLLETGTKNNCSYLDPLAPTSVLELDSKYSLWFAAAGTRGSASFAWESGRTVWDPNGTAWGSNGTVWGSGGSVCDCVGTAWDASRAVWDSDGTS